MPQDFVQSLAGLRASLAALHPSRLHGQVSAVNALAVELSGLAHHLTVGDRITLHPRAAPPLPAEITAITGTTLTAAPFGPTSGLGAGTPATTTLPARAATIAPAQAWLGRVIDPLGHAADGGPPLPPGPRPMKLRAAPPPATTRARLGPAIDLGVRALNCFTTCRTGQRLGLFAGSGIGKSTLLAMLARYTACDVTVLALVGERGREVREFIEDDLGPEGLERAVVVVATGDAPPLLRREAAYTALTVAEYFRDQGKSVLLLMDSVTRFALALRELGLANGEPPATRGYPPSVFAELPRLLERAGPGPIRADGPAGQITALFTVLVEGSDHEEPIADAVRGILDGHVILDRRIGEAGRYPAIDVLRSLSRAAASLHTPAQAALLRQARAHLALHGDMADMIRLGAYRAGSDPAVDAAIKIVPRLEAMLTQAKDEPASLQMSFEALAAALNG